MRSKNFITYSLFLNLYNIEALKTIYRSTGIVTGMIRLLVDPFCYWSTGIVAGMGFATFVAAHGCAFFPQHDDANGT